jgi:SAM-dependent methyltransferase
MSNLKDPIGNAILDYSKHGFTENIIVESDLCDNDILPVEYLFRPYDEMPEIEKTALDAASGDILEVGAGSGCHAKYLNKKGFNTFSIDTSKGAIEHIKKEGLNCENIPFLNLKGKTFDTILILMNGLGLAGKLQNVGDFLSHAKSLLKPNGSIITDSSDIRYLYEDDEGGVWIDLNSKYPGEMEFKMTYKDSESDWFPWVYLDFETLAHEAEKVGLKATKILENENFHYLTQLEII